MRLDAVFINAGMAKFAAVADVEEAMWDATFNANVKGAFFQIQALLPILNPAATAPVFRSLAAYPAPHAWRMHGPTMPLVPIIPISGENKCMLPPRPREQPVCRPNNSAISSCGGNPLASA